MLIVSLEHSMQVCSELLNSDIPELFTEYCVSYTGTYKLTNAIP